MSLVPQEFKDNLQAIVLASNSYQELVDEFSLFCLSYKLGNPGDDVFRIVLDELQKRLNEERNER